MDELARLELEAAAVDSAVDAAIPLAPGQEPPPPPDPAKEAADVFGLAVVVLSPMLPYLPAIYTPDRVQAIAAAYVPVAEKYGWDLSGTLGKYSAELGLALAVLPTVPAVLQAHRALAAERDAAKRAAQKATSPPGAVPSETPAPASPGPHLVYPVPGAEPQ